MRYDRKENKFKGKPKRKMKEVIQYNRHGIPIVTRIPRFDTEFTRDK